MINNRIIVIDYAKVVFPMPFIPTIEITKKPFSCVSNLATIFCTLSPKLILSRLSTVWEYGISLCGSHLSVPCPPLGPCLLTALGLLLERPSILALIWSISPPRQSWDLNLWKPVTTLLKLPLLLNSSLPLMKSMKSTAWQETTQRSSIHAIPFSSSSADSKSSRKPFMNLNLSCMLLAFFFTWGQRGPWANRAVIFSITRETTVLVFWSSIFPISIQLAGIPSPVIWSS